MKANLLKRIASILVCTALVASMAACASSSDDSSSSSSDSSSSSSSSDDTSSDDTATEDGPLTPYEEAVTITWGVQVSAVQQFFDGDTYEDNLWSRLIKEELNIDLEVAFSADTSTDAYENKVQLLLATGEYPDVFRFTDRTFYQESIEAGYLQDISDVFDEYASDGVKYYQEAFPDCFDGATYDDGLYAFPYMTDNFHQAQNLWIRDDWLENTDTTAPTTIDEFVELVRIYTEEDPNGNGVDDTYGLALQSDILAGNVGSITGLLSSYGVPGGIFYEDENGDITYGYIQEECKEALTLLSEMYAAGYIDPTFVTKDITAMETDVTNGVIGMMYHECWGTWHPFNYSYQADGVITRPYSVPEADGYDTLIGVDSNQMGELFMIGADCENPEALIKILNLYETIMNTDDAEIYDTYWSNEQYRFCPIFIGMPTELSANVLLPALEAGSSEGLSGYTLQYYNYVVGFEDGSLADDTSAYGTWGQMFESGSMSIDLDHQSEDEIVTDLMANDIPDIWSQNSSVLYDMTVIAFTEIITGAQDVDYFDTFVENWLAAGGQATIDALEEIYA